jgi:hypothetical protein
VHQVGIRTRAAQALNVIALKVCSLGGENLASLFCFKRGEQLVERGENKSVVLDSWNELGSHPYSACDSLKDYPTHTGHTIAQNTVMIHGIPYQGSLSYLTRFEESR